MIYIVVKILQRNWAVKTSYQLGKDERIEYWLAQFKLKRKIEILVNDSIKVPLTYGIIRLRIILQSSILKDDELLKYVIIHEMTHIKKFDIVFNHLKNLIVSLHWYNFFVLVAARYAEDDIEALCDKLVICRVGDTAQHRKEYCLSMLKLLEQKEGEDKEGLKLHQQLKG